MKKILTIMCSLILCVVTLTGCNMLELDKKKYYEQVVASVTSEQSEYVREYTKKELIEAYYNYSYSNVQNGSVTAEQGVKTAFNSMIERGLLIAGIEKEYIKTGEIDFTEEHENQIREEAFEYMQDQIFNYEDEIRIEKGITPESEDQATSEEEVEESLRAEYEKYEPQIIYNEEIDGAVKNTELDHDTILGYTVPLHFTQKITDEAISKEAYVRYVKALQKSAKSEGRDTSESEVIKHEEERLIKLLTENKYLELFEEYLAQNNVYNVIDANGNITVREDVLDKVVDYYKKQYNAQKNLFDLNINAYHTAMGSDASKVYYHPNSGEEYMYVSHILLKFSDSQASEVKALKGKLENKQISQDEYDRKVKNIANNIQVVYEKNNEVYTSNAEEVYKTIVDYVNTYGGNDVEKRAKLFNDMIYIYNDDEGIMNKDFAYVVNLKTTVEDKMVKEFANASRELNENPEKGVGSMSEMVITEYGVHIIFHAGLVENIITSNNIDNLTYQALFKHNTQLSSNKTLFNFVYDQLTFNDYATRTTDLVKQIKGNVVIDDYVDNYDDLYE